MCGIFGLAASDVSPQEMERGLRRMAEVLRHRGPDETGFHIVPGWGGVGACRLSIIDPAGGHQPFTNEDGTVVLVCNGEIYNYIELRSDLQKRGHRFRSGSDAEVIVHLYEEEGSDSIRHLRGMFAFALADLRERSLILVRDRLGKKPLYYYRGEGELVFASEAKALFQHARVPRSVNTDVLDDYLAFGYVPAPQSMFRGISKLGPAHMLTYREGTVRVSRYWQPRLQLKNVSIGDHADAVAAELSRSVALRLRSDVPLGVFLSGGIDSAIVTKLAADHAPGRLKTFSVGFDRPEYSESRAAEETSRMFHTDHYHLCLQSDALEVLPRLVWHVDEPFGDSSLIPTYYVSRLASGHVKSVLSGDGGDELFGGYRRRYLTVMASDFLQRTFGPFTMAMAGMAKGLEWIRSAPSWDRILQVVEVMDRPLSEVYRAAVGVFPQRMRRQVLSLPEGDESSCRRLFSEALNRPAHGDRINALCMLDLESYLPNDILTKVDIASMANSIEVRCPFLDHVLVELAFTIPGPMKLGWGDSKIVLKRAFRGSLPQGVVRRKKQGFAIPLTAWLRSPHGAMLYDTVCSPRFFQRGYFRRNRVMELLHRHRSGRADHSAFLWSLLMLELWHRTFIDSPAVPQDFHC